MKLNSYESHIKIKSVNSPNGIIKSIYVTNCILLGVFHMWTNGIPLTVMKSEAQRTELAHTAEFSSRPSGSGVPGLHPFNAHCARARMSTHGVVSDTTSMWRVNLTLRGVVQPSFSLAHSFVDQEFGNGVDGQFVLGGSYVTAVRWQRVSNHLRVQLGWTSTVALSPG